CSHHATLADSQGSRTSMRWWGTRRRSSGPGLAVPISIPRYKAMESIDTISPPRRLASSTPSKVLPEPVGPVRIKALRKGSRIIKIYYDSPRTYDQYLAGENGGVTC